MSDEDEYEDKKYKKRGPPKKEFKKSKRIKNDPKKLLYDETEDITCSPDSILCTIDLKDIINLKTFNNCLTTEEKESLLKYLPHVDKISKESVYNVFKNNLQFQASMELYQDMLETGSFCDGKPIEKKELMDPYKNVNIMKDFGVKKKNQQQLNEEILEKQYLGIPLDQNHFSFIEYEKEQLALGVPVEAIFPKVEDEPEKVELAKPLSQRRKKSAGDLASPATSPNLNEKPTDEFEDEEIDLDKDEGWGPTVFIEDEDDDIHVEEEDGANSSEGEKKKKKSTRGRKSKTADKSSTFRNGAIEILRNNGRPMSAIDIVQKGLSSGIFSNLSGKTPQNTLAALLYVEIKKNGALSEFTKVGPGKFGLKEFAT